MRNLHGIINAALEAWVWGYAYGANGRALGAGTGGNTHWMGGNIHHSYRIERGEPPAPFNSPDDWRRRNRRYWNPWGQGPVTNEARLTPACGRIRTQSRSPRFSLAGHGAIEMCPDCQRLRPETTNYRQLQTGDPWFMQVPIAEREHTPDPVTGL